MNDKKNFLAKEGQIEQEESIYVASTDIKVLSDKKLDIKEGAPIVVIEKTPNGWWYVEVDGEKGWIRSEKTQRKRVKKSSIELKKENLKSLGEEKDTYITLADFDASELTCISFVKNQLVEVIEKSDVGWWFVKIGNQEGWAPSTYLGKVSSKINNVKDLNKVNLTTNSVSENENTPELEGKKYNTQPTKTNIKREINIPESVPKPSPRAKPSLEPFSKMLDNINSHFSNVKKTSNSTLENKPSVVDKGVKPDKPSRKLVQIEPKPSCIVTSSQTNLKVSVAPPRPPPPKFQATSKPIPAIPVEIYIAIGNYEDSDEGMLNLKKGQLVYVLEKDDGGWWYAKVDNCSGWVPSNFLKLSS